VELGIAGRTALIAGGSAGLGLACALELLRGGAKVSIAGRSPDRLAAAEAELVRSVPDAGDRLLTRSVDLADAAGLTAWVQATDAHFGQIDIAIANAGGPPVGTATAVTLGQYRDALELNLLASINLADTVVAGMRSRGWGRILFITSISAKQPVPNLALSNTARAGMLGYAKSLADEVAAEGVTVNVLAPGYTRTARLLDAFGEDRIDELAQAEIPMGRVGEPHEFAAAAAFLASDRASFITGVVLPVDGGSIRSLY
jgi:3-oxoacyl-[acyl-carrier protein] reductase